MQRLFPKMYPLRQRILPDGGRLEAYRVRKIGWAFYPLPMPMRGDEIDFVFENDRLMEWGNTVGDVFSSAEVNQFKTNGLLSPVITAVDHAQVAHIAAFGDVAFTNGVFDGATGFVEVQTVMKSALV